MQTAQLVTETIEKQLIEKGYEILDVQNQKDKRHGIKIVLTIDRTDGALITHTDCGLVTRIAKEHLEELFEDYVLEVSSPGINRPLKKAEHFSRFITCPVKICLDEPIRDMKTLKGTIETVGEKEIHLRISGIDEIVSVPYNNIQKANLLNDKI